MSDIFLSYASQDREQARLLADSLANRGWSVWWDRDIRSGRTYIREITRELKAASCVLVLWSRASVDSDWVLEEANYARNRKILLPVLIENVTPPIGFTTIQAVDLREWDGDTTNIEYEKGVEDIARLIGTRVGDPPSPEQAAGEGLHGSTAELAGNLRPEWNRAWGALAGVVPRRRGRLLVEGLTLATAWAVAFAVSLSMWGNHWQGWAAAGAIGGAVTGEVLRRRWPGFRWWIVPLIGASFSLPLSVLPTLALFHDARDIASGHRVILRFVSGPMRFDHEFVWAGALGWCLVAMVVSFSCWMVVDRPSFARLGVLWNSLLISCAGWAGAWLSIRVIGPALFGALSLSRTLKMEMKHGVSVTTSSHSALIMMGGLLGLIGGVFTLASVNVLRKGIQNKDQVGSAH